MVEVLLDVLENLPDNVVVIFTTTNEGQELFSDAQVDAGPFASRCICLKLSDQGLTQQFAERALKIAQMEGLDGQPLSAYVTLVKKHRANFRAILGAIEQGIMLN